jgi:nicotinamidase-related amidase
LQFALRDREITTLAICGIALEIGIEPTIRHAADLGIYLFLSQALAVQATKKDSAPSISLASWKRLDHNRSHVLRRAPRSEE